MRFDNRKGVNRHRCNAYRSGFISDKLLHLVNTRGLYCFFLTSPENLFLVAVQLVVGRLYVDSVEGRLQRAFAEKEPTVMSELTPDLAEVGDFCPNEACLDAGKTDAGNIVKYGTTPKGLQRYRCKTCGKTFSENTGTIFYNKHTPAKEIIEPLALVAEGSRVASLSRVKGYKEETIRNWLQQAAAHATQIENALMSEYEIDRGQIDALWSYVGHKKQDNGEGKKDALDKDALDDERGIYWRSTMIDIDTRLRVGRGIAKTETEASEEVFQTLRQNRGHLEKPPPTISDGWGGIREAMVQVWGKVPEYKGHGRPPEKKRPQQGWPRRLAKKAGRTFR